MPNNDKKQMVNIYDEALKHYGILRQVAKTNEELGELIVVMSHYFYEGKVYKIDVAQEIADVEIMCNQLRQLIGNDLVNNCKIVKLKRLRRRLDDAEEETGSH